MAHFIGLKENDVNTSFYATSPSDQARNIAKDLLELIQKFGTILGDVNKKHSEQHYQQTNATQGSFYAQENFQMGSSQFSSPHTNLGQYPQSDASKIEKNILNASNPFSIDEAERINKNGFSGIWMNKEEVQSWKAGPIALDDYEIFNDPNPEYIKKTSQAKINSVQNVEYKYFKPPPAPKPGDLTIRREPDILPPIGIYSAFIKPFKLSFFIGS